MSIRLHALIRKYLLRTPPLSPSLLEGPLIKLTVVLEAKRASQGLWVERVKILKEINIFWYAGLQNGPQVLQRLGIQIPKLLKFGMRNLFAPPHNPAPIGHLAAYPSDALQLEDARGQIGFVLVGRGEDGLPLDVDIPMSM